MGNEASSESHENDEDVGLQPPSQMDPPEMSKQQQHTHQNKALKAAKAIVQRGQEGIQQIRNHHQQHRGGAQHQNQTNHYNGSSNSRNNYLSPTNSNGSNSTTVGVIYATQKEGGSTRSLPSSGSSIRGGRGIRYSGKALINSMRNLSLRGAADGKHTSPISRAEVSEWAKRWDEDGDDSSSDSAEDDDSITPAKPAASPASVPPPIPPLQQQQHRSVSDSRILPQVYQQKPELSKSPQGGTPERTVSHDQYEKPNVNMFLPLLRVLGKGSFGKVVLVQKRSGKETGALFAMKILRKTHLVQKRQIERTRTERKVLSVVDHPFIMKLHYAFQTDDKLYLVLDYCPGGELFFHLSRFRRFPERVARFYTAELLLAIGHLHKRGIIYRDLKPENVLLDADGHVKLGDFGLAKAGIRHPYQGALSMCGTPEYMAPEVLSQAGHGFVVDYWGLGMLVYEMMTGLPPWYTTDRSKLFRRLKSAPLDIPSYFSVHAADIASGLLERNPTRRLGVTGIRTAMEHEFFRSISWRALYARRVEAPIRPCEGWKPPEPEDDVSMSNATSPSSKIANQFSSSQSSSHEMPAEALDAATANFDNTFTRMPVDTEDDQLASADAANGGSNSALLEELHENTFVGFTFDVEHKGEIVAVAGTPHRSRTRHYSNAQSTVSSSSTTLQDQQLFQKDR